MQMVLRTLSVGELRSPNSTPRHHSKKQRAKARALFAEQGIVVPIIVDDRMRIIDGAVRLMRTRIGLLAQPEPMRSIIGGTQREQRLD